MDSSSSDDRRKLSDRIFAAPFGRFQSSGESGPSHEGMVGREEERAYFIELLLRMGRRGAYLVTGRRGVGKTSFVNYCLSEYKEEVFARFLRSNVGRVAFWDHIGILFLALCIIFGFLLVSELMEIITFSTGWGKGDQPNVLFALVILPLAAICLYPFLYARSVIAIIISSGLVHKRSQSRELLAGLIASTVAVIVFRYMPPFGAPALSMSRMLLGICGLYAWVQASSFNFVGKPSHGGRKESKLRSLIYWLADPANSIVLVYCVTAIMYIIVGPGLVAGLSGRPILQADQEFWRNLAWALSLLGTGCLLRGVHLRGLLENRLSSPSLQAPEGLAGSLPSRWYLGFGAALSVGGWLAYYSLVNGDAGALWYLAISFASVLLPLLTFLGLRALGSRALASRESQFQFVSFRPRPRVVMGAKAFISIVVTLHLIHPIFDRVTPPRVEEVAWKSHRLRESTNLFHVSSLSEKENEARTTAEDFRRLQEKSERDLKSIRDRLDVLRQEELEFGALTMEESETVRTLETEALLLFRDAKYNQKNAEGALREAVLNRQRWNAAVFYGRSEELSWVLALWLLMVVFFLIEYEWVLRPFVRRREDRALHLAHQAPWRDDSPSFRDSPGSRDRHYYRQFARLTLPWTLYDKWLPILTISVNLGFEKLDHRRVVHAMLAGLRDQYHRTFLAWNSGLANTGRILGLLLAMMLMTLSGDRWFSMPDLGRGELNAKDADKLYSGICPYFFEGRQRGPGAANWLCRLKWGEDAFHILNYNLLEAGDLGLYPERDLHLLFYVFPYREQDWPPPDAWSVAPGGAPAPFIAHGIHFRVYHLVLFLVFFLVGRWLLHRLPIFPYYELERRIDATMDSLQARTSVTSTVGRWKPAQWLQGFFMDERVRQTEQEPVDPRTVEFVFLQLLRDVQYSPVHLSLGRRQVISLPTPEVTFVLDELDKIGTRVDPEEIGSSGNPQQVEIVNTERRRSMELHKLLADMKNLLSSAPARFIFVGGRNLHDEWLADQTARQPLLTNIFSAEVYLPCLLTDHDGQADRRLSYQVERYLYKQIERAKKLFNHTRENRWLPVLGLPLEQPRSEEFIMPSQAESSSSVEEGAIVGGDWVQGLRKELHFYDIESSQNNPREFSGGSELVSEFIYFLTYRSMGSPKRLKELLSTFVRPAGRIVIGGARWTHFKDCDHILYFGETERFRIQFLAHIYRHLTLHFEQGLVRRDDKLVVSVLYLTDFLFKFHRRAFSWSNLERVDELGHIHRAPDLREVLEAIVAQWSERFLHPIRNGMYDFRFRSDTAREVDYVSRQSADEMAAFNFTLDESQALKSAYETNIARLKDGGGKELQDLVAGLGELYEFDQEYETARLYYRRAISLLDQELESMVGESPFNLKSARIEIFASEGIGQRNARLYMSWGIARLRLMLQIGMTYEHSRNLERAETAYQNARTLASALLTAMLDDEGRVKASGLGIETALDGMGDDRLHSLKHLNLLFQPMFAQVWVAEKLAGGVDTSATLAEKELWKLRHLLPFMRQPEIVLSESGANAQGSNFSLIGTELHNKAGDLYFFKGRQVGDSTALLESLSGARPCSRGFEGFLLAAQYHYAVGLHELRRFIVHRKESSCGKLTFWGDPGSAEKTITREGWPDFVFRAVGGALNDLAEALLGQTSLLGVLKKASWPAGDLGPEVEELVSQFTTWLEWDSTVSPLSSAAHHSISVWLGDWRVQGLEDGRLIEFRSSSFSDAELLRTSLTFSLVGAKYLQKGGYLEDAGRELLKVAETATHYLWWTLMVRQVVGISPAGSNNETPGVFRFLVDIGIYALVEAQKLFERSRRWTEEIGGYYLGEKIPVPALTICCSLGLSACRWGQAHVIKEPIGELVEKWTGFNISAAHSQGLRSLLKESLLRNSYPMLNRLHALKVLIDNAVLSRGGDEEEVGRWTRELLELEANFNAPLHFTPLHSGVTCAVAQIFSSDKTRGTIRLAAERALLTSQEMYTMRRAFYESISGLHYLYDDFNDRQLHFNHAIQMAGSDLATLLREELATPGSATQRFSAVLGS